ncbi:aspartyl-tRNA synthetase [Marinitoga sp. 1135]|uniref:Aspartate--tRNA ligase n=1 Tax=Marinitoga piezophila (strain DSM 14283 / JCM 11233 / KA3) TaxID=443254 RepID=H2J645_MARPK|nr:MULTISPECIES: aspartate--tRNA ligase [Marinitoga]AEX85106.1 aspartyl-tRNA synthetase [Marinitoga piezophila KA3]APT75610.1 aspartyl-tRNA synthetase [Marinitoga sp. 1137]NUU95319.1 aspartyl-tRNA synthetase [Marinitoga sp. 1135]NUU97253.1 aspartyl-tRNA synthetase [Marinitoga sp. 1138]
MKLKRTHKCGNLNSSNIGQEVILNGWVERIRDLGGIKFGLLRDISGKVQFVIDPENKEIYEIAKTIGNEYVIAIKGVVRKRPDDAINKNMPTGEIEIDVNDMEVLSESETPPIYVNKDEEISENLRLKYRYLDLRKDRMKKNLVMRHKALQIVRQYLSENDFLEIETPYLTKSTPEGARDFLVPSRLKPGNFYALPQSPQLFKQLLMVSGFDRYFQIARCFRDEDFRADRQPEFSQIDFEMSFVEMDDILTLTEGLLKKLFKELLDYDLETPLRRFTYDEVMNKYGSDKPDTRYGLEINDFSEDFKETKADFIRKVIENGGKIKGIVLSEKADKFSRKRIDEYTEFAKSVGAGGLIWIKNEKGEVKSSIKKIAENEIKNIFDKGLIKDNDIAFLIVGENEEVNKILGHIRVKLIKEEMEKKDGFDVLWVVDFPMFAWDEEENRLVAEHHPFTMPKLDDFEKYADSDPLKIRAQCYDLVINGYEMASGSIRIHRKDLQNKIFEMIGLSDEEINEKFGFLIEAFKYGPPPHGGAAIGFDRLIAVMAGEDSIKEVIAFPKTASGSDPMTEAPSEVSEKQLNELKIKLDL